MNIFTIIAYEEELEEQRLKWSTGITVYAESSAEALDKAKKIFLAKKYWIKDIREIGTFEIYGEAMMNFIDKQIKK